YITKPVRVPDLQKAIDRWQARTRAAEQAPAGADGPKPAVTVSNLPPIDFERLGEITENDPEQLRSLVKLFREESALTFAKLVQAVDHGAMDEIRQCAHKLAGSSSTCGMDPLAGRLHELEQSALNRDAAGVATGFAHGKAEYERLEIELAKLAAGTWRKS
ncbi:MAG: histidine kinase, partial [Verrucomicrobiales bacterium]|nr:histidine kinase [Verrucomicrobiales bacterium]